MKATKAQLQGLILHSAGQLGRKLREWGLYKYDNKNRPSTLTCIDSGRRNNPESLPLVGSDVDVRHLAEKRLPDVVTSASALPSANGGHCPPNLFVFLIPHFRYYFNIPGNDATFRQFFGRNKFFYPV